MQPQQKKYWGAPLILTTLLCCTLLLSSCVTGTRPTQSLDFVLGTHVDGVVKTWGPPQSSFTLADNSIIYEWRRYARSQGSSNVYLGGSPWSWRRDPYFDGYHYGGYYNTAPQEYWCTVRITVDPNKIIQEWQSQGNACSRLLPTPHTVYLQSTNATRPVTQSSTPPAPQTTPQK